MLFIRSVEPTRSQLRILRLQPASKGHHDAPPHANSCVTAVMLTAAWCALLVRSGFALLGAVRPPVPRGLATARSHRMATRKDWQAVFDGVGCCVTFHISSPHTLGGRVRGMGVFRGSATRCARSRHHNLSCRLPQRVTIKQKNGRILRKLRVVRDGFKTIPWRVARRCYCAASVIGAHAIVWRNGLTHIFYRYAIGRYRELSYAQDFIAKVELLQSIRKRAGVKTS